MCQWDTKQITLYALLWLEKWGWIEAWDVIYAKTTQYRVWDTQRAYPGERPRNGKQNIYFSLFLFNNHSVSPALENDPAQLKHIRHFSEQRRMHVFYSNLQHCKHGPRSVSDLREWSENNPQRWPHLPWDLTSKRRALIREGGKCPNQLHQLSFLRFKA